MQSRLRAYFKSLVFGCYVMVNPFKGFWEMKREKRGSMAAAVTLLALGVVTLAVRAQYTGFAFNANYFKQVDLFQVSLGFLIPFGLWCVASYGLTALMSGEGSLRDIFMAACYSLMPLVLLELPLTLLSRFLTLEEASFVTFVQGLAICWVCFLLISGMLEIQQYTMTKTVVTVLLTLIGMAIILFLSLLAITLLDKMWVFVADLIKEAVLRLR